MLATQGRGELEGFPSGSVVEYAADAQVSRSGAVWERVCVCVVRACVHIGGWGRARDMRRHSQDN